MAVLRLPGIVTDDDALERALGVKRSLASMEADQYQYLLDYLDECAADADVVRLCGAERVHAYGGDGTPDIPEFAVCEIAATLGQANRTASALVADILDLRHRLPLLFGCLRNGQVDAWRVRRVASGTREFDLDTVGRVDARLARAAADGQPVIARMSRSRLRKVIDQFGCADEPEKTEDEVAENLANRFVRFAPGGIGTHEISGTVASGPARRLYARMDEIAGWLGEVDAADGQERRSKDVRRSVALTMLADPDQVADLHDLVQQLRQRCATETPADDPATGDTANDAAAGDDPASSADGGESGDGGDPRPRRCPNCGGREAFQRPARLPATVLYVHLDAATGTWSLDGHGPITHGEATGLVGHSHVTVKPVIDLASNITYTGYVAPPRLKEQTALANQGFCTFPNCGNSAWRGEYDHIVDYHARGPTDARNGHRLCKHHHRAKTFTDWTVISPAQGVWLWRSPRSRFYLVTEGTTTPLELDLFRYAA